MAANQRHSLYPLMTSPPSAEEFAAVETPVMRTAPTTPASAYTREDSRGRLRKPLPNNHHMRSSSAQLPTPTLVRTPPETYRYSYFDGAGAIGAGGNAEVPLAPKYTFRGDYDSHNNSRASSFERSRPGSPSSNQSRPMTPIINLPEQQRSQSRPSTPSGATGGTAKDINIDKKKSNFLHKKQKDSKDEAQPMAWIAGHPQKQAYDTSSLFNGRPMQELWDDNDGNCLVYLFPKHVSKGASFKIDSAVFAASPVLTKLAFGDLYSGHAAQNGGDRRNMPLDGRMHGLSLQGPATPPRSPRQRRARAYGDGSDPNAVSPTSSSASRSSRGRMSNLSDPDRPAAETHLYLPVKLQDPSSVQLQPTSQEGVPDDFQTLIDIRNFFAFLTGSSLVATQKKATFFHIFMTIAGILKTYEFSNLDGSTFGEVANSSFDSYVEELGLADVRRSREKTIEGVVLGERMKSVLLYNEAFTHAAGKYEDLVNLKSPKFSLMSSATDNRLIRAAMDLDKRILPAEIILKDFEFPALLTGFMSSKTSTERKDGVRFEAWKEAFLGFRKNYLSTLKHRYGDWPPRASSKKNNLETSGLNRVVLRHLYKDMCDVYDLLVDREHLTTRTVDGVSNDANEREESTIRALRVVLSEYDRSSPPVKPPVPFDLPILPKIRSLRPDFGNDKKKDIQLLQRRLKDDEISQILLQSWNRDCLANSNVDSSPFLKAFWDMERRAAHGCTFAELVDLRIGQWIFMYVILQALPMLACDAPGLKHTKGVEYFLCEPPRKGVPWANPNAPTPTGASLASAGPNGRTWFSVGEGENVVALPADVVEHGVEGIFRRSHCWAMAEKWTQGHPIMNEALHEQEAQNAAAEEAARYKPRPSSRYRPVSGYFTPTELTPPTTGYSGFGNAGGGGGYLSPDSRPSSRPPSRTSNRNSSLSLGLEALPLPMGVTPDGSAPQGYYSPGGARRSSGPGTPQERSASATRSAVDASKTFDAILGGIGSQSGNGGGGKKIKK